MVRDGRGDGYGTGDPPLPAAQANALGMLLHQDVGLSEVAAVIESDPVMTAAVLRAANSADSSPVSEIMTAADAIVRLGARTARAVLLALTLHRQSADIGRAGIDAGALSTHSIGCALLAEAALRHAQSAAVPAFTAGMLHDIGRLAMASQHPRHYVRVARMVGQGVEALRAEHDVFGVDHSEYGGNVARAWSLPEDHVTAVVEHHGATSSPLASFVATGCRTMTALGGGDGVNTASEPSLAEGSVEETVVMQSGGQKRIAARIAWFRGALV